jgi:putative transposase
MNKPDSLELGYTEQLAEVLPSLQESTGPVRIDYRELRNPEQIETALDVVESGKPLRRVSAAVPSLNLHPAEPVHYKHDAEARLFGRFCTEVIERLDNCESKVSEWVTITADYNAGRFVPELFRLRGHRSERALRLWLETYLDHNCDMYSLIHKGRNEIRGRKVTYAEQNYLLSLLLSPKRIKVYTAVQNLKSMAKMGLLESPSGVKTLQRWCEDWAKDHPAVWAQARNGSKFVSEKIVKSILRDDSLLAVNDVWVADGHKLAFDVINPATGKPIRMTMILVIDWASRYPVGASLAVSEDSQHICVAFRNGFLNAYQPGREHENPLPAYAVLPKHVYLDNGKAFRSKLFNEKWEDHDLATELGGIFPRLGIGVTFAEAYNARAKIIERFFHTMQEQFERFIGTFRGASIADKPAWLDRNEAWMQKMFKGDAPTVDETMRMISFYVRHIYGETPHSGLKGKTPWEVFSGATPDPERLIEPSELNYMMLAVERKKIRAEGLRLNHCLYWHDNLVNHVGKPVVIRFDYADARWVLVYTLQNQFICQAEVRRLQHPFLKLAADRPTAHKELQKEHQQIKKLLRQTQQATKQVVKRTQEAVDELIKPSSLTDIEPELFVKPPLIAPPQPQVSLDRMALEAFRERHDNENDVDEAIEAEVQVEADELPFPQVKRKSFDEMLKAIGIK